MNRKRILWLVSWYPNRYDKFNGDFIQRHAQAASIDNDIHVIYLQDTFEILDSEEEINKRNGLTEQIIYYRVQRGILGKAIKQFRYFSIYKNAVEKYIQNYGIPHCVHVHVPWKAGLIALWMKRKYNLPFFVSEHWGIYQESLPDSYRKKSIFFRRLVKEIFKSARDVVVVSNRLGQDINALVLSTKYHVIPNVVDVSKFKTSLPKYPLFTFLHVSNMVSLKNVGNILLSFQKFLSEKQVNAQLILIGNQDDEYTTIASKLGLLNKGVFFKGEIAYEEVAQEMQKAHCLIMNSTYETFSCVIAEALCCGLPVIATNVGFVPEVVNDRNGIIIRDLNDLIRAMKEIHDKHQLLISGDISEGAKSLFNFEKVSSQFDYLYKQVNKVL